jgi:hypothetical protein
MYEPWMLAHEQAVKHTEIRNKPKTDHIVEKIQERPLWPTLVNTAMNLRVA